LPNFPKPIVDGLRAGGHDVLWARTDCAGWKDSALLRLAGSTGRVTLDKDFPLEQSGVVLFRVHPATPERLAPLAGWFVDANRAWAGHISIVSPEGIQMVGARKR